MASQTSYPVAEIFSSIQGEGYYAGTPMTFIRLAGCNVGKYTQPTDTYAICESFDGTKFTCDTNYKMSKRYSVAELVAEVKCEHICLSGGEPFNQDLEPLIETMFYHADVHIETSGTKPIECGSALPWITCSPKAGFLPENAIFVNEWKFVVNEASDFERIKLFLKDEGKEAQGAEVFISPINGVFDFNKAEAKRVHDMLVSDFPKWRLNLQLHKILGVR